MFQKILILQIYLKYYFIQNQHVIANIAILKGILSYSAKKRNRHFAFKKIH